MRSLSGLGSRGGGAQDGAQPGGRKWLGGVGGGAFGKSMKKVSSAFGKHRGGPANDDVHDMEASRGDSPNPAENVIAVPDQYRLNSIRGSASDPSARDSPGSVKARGSDLSELSNVAESEESHMGGLGRLSGLDRTRTIHVKGGGGAARVTGMDKGSRTSLDGTDSLDPANPEVGVTSI